MISNWKTVYERRVLLKELVRQELKEASADTILGWLWWLLDPLLLMLIYWLLFTFLRAQMFPAYQPYPVFILCGLVAWKAITASMARCLPSLRARGAIINAIPFPTMVVPLSIVTARFVFFLFAFVVCVGVALVWRSTAYEGSFLALAQVVPLMVMQVTVTAGVCLVLATVGVFARDVIYAMEYVLRLGFFLTPILYGSEVVRDLARQQLGETWGGAVYQAYMLNPAALIVEGYRRCLLYGTLVPLEHWLVLLVEGLLALWIGTCIYQRYDRRLIKAL